MINSLKTIAVFGSNFTGIYRYPLTKAFDKAAGEIGMNLVYINYIGRVGTSYVQYGEYEFDLLKNIEVDQFDGIIYDGEGYNDKRLAVAAIEKLRGVKCPVISISSYVEGFHNVRFDDLYGFRLLVEHFLDHHHFTKIGFMSGYLTHPDARGRLKEFRAIMREHGLPEDGVGMFEGDFWFNKGEQAADYFLSLPERPEAIVCANDYMALSLITAFKKRGISIPEDIAISGFDGTADGQETMLPHLTTATREQYALAKSVLTAMEKLIEGDESASDICVRSSPIYSHSCGCLKLDYRKESEKIDDMYHLIRGINYHVLDAEAAVIRLDQADSLEKMQTIFNELAVNFGSFRSFFLMLYADDEGRLSCNSDFTSSSGRLKPVMWLDHDDEYIRPEGLLEKGYLIPQSSSERSHSYLLTSIHTSEHCFGFATIEMDNDGRSREFYVMWLVLLGMTLETLYKNDRISKLIDSLESKSFRDDLTGLYNRRGFYKMSQDELNAAENVTVCTFIIDMDGLKRINDGYGHYEGDNAIKALARMISLCCENGEVAGRTGGDEFSVFAVDYPEEKAQQFIRRLQSMAQSYNETSTKPYQLSVSCGYSTAPSDKAEIDELLKISDSRMYKEKSRKKNSRK